MRLICPNCGAQYEVPPEAIPPAGRDVQCSACGRTWFERPSASESAAEEAEPWDRVPRVSGDEEEADDLAEAQAAPPPVAPPRSTVTPEVAGILRAEAEREAQARADEGGKRPAPAADRPAVTFEQPTPVPEKPAVAVERPVAAAEPPPAVPPVSKPAPLAAEPLPQSARAARPLERAIDIDQINSSLRSVNGHIDGKAPQVGPPRRRGGFASGFWGALVVMAVLAGLYLAAPSLVAAVPEVGVVLNPYVAAVNESGHWLDRQVGALLGAEAPAE